ncbi:MAG: hypothetical protein WCK39_08425 [Methanomassiliicoccales archaeon]
MAKEKPQPMVEEGCNISFENETPEETLERLKREGNIRIRSTGQELSFEEALQRSIAQNRRLLKELSKR